ncbi:hypothetical protein SPBR_06565 [Sporothrix brasiliensis 5110]|uniref:Altered inheritance of mitochondria protein 21 n=1 Tax=Sporothrix brasiliensis 5110 TaxID=1398154 RepID=A0A0C2FE68_9PEZI|nr:uncharacterized protein SPBR_06565 [Sporothrix brasiliensis 5110]KIH89438.1 hypothetical protein SPBR_06565 [Sporothrix brasiliensis 5110]
MSAATQQPVVPPRPIKAQDTPKIPPRPARRAVDRSLSPSRDRFAPSPLDSLLSKSPSRATFNLGSSNLASDPIDRAGSVDLPTVGQEGIEYDAVAEELSASKSQAGSSRAASPEHTRTVGDDVKLHAPKPSLPAISAKQRVATVTRTDSEKAASFGIGQASSGGDTKKKASTASQDLSSNEDGLEDDEHGIPEIGRQVPMYPNAGDVQAPSPGPDAVADGGKRNHSRKKSARGFGDLPPGSYGLHGHGVIASDKLEKAYYGKHPELIEKEHTPHDSDRTQDYSMTSADLNKIVRETASRGSGIATHGSAGTPSEQVGWQAIDESVSRPASVALKGKANSFGSQSSAADKGETPGISFSAPNDDNNVIHVDDPNNHRKSVMFNEDEGPDFDYEGEAPILAPDEVAKDPSGYEHEPAVVPAFERRLSSFDGEDGSSRHSSRPASIYRVSSIPQESAIAEEKAEDEYEPLFQDGDSKTARAASVSAKSITEEGAPRFPSRDIWEDAPSSAHHTAEVSTPDMPIEQHEEGYVAQRPSTDSPREGETPAQAFARQQEELAEKELQGADAFAENRKPRGPASSPLAKKEILAPAGNTHAPSSSPASASSLRRPQLGQRFPSRDVWEDVPESLRLQTVVSNPQGEEASSPLEASKPTVPQRPARKLTDSSDKAAPVVPSRPKPKTASSEEDASKPAVSDKPKPVVPTRPVRHQQPSADQEPESVPRSKPAVPARPFGGKISQLQANFMSDLNKKLKIGPQAPKKDDPEPTENAPEAEKAPLVDARKGRARGPQRSAPRAAASTTAPVTSSAPTLAFSTTTTLYSIDPEDGGLIVTSGKISSSIPEAEKDEPAAVEPDAVEKKKGEEPAANEEAKVETAEPAEAAEPAEPAEKTQTIASNTAGEPLVEAKVEASGDSVEPAAAEEPVAAEE